MASARATEDGGNEGGGVGYGSNEGGGRIRRKNRDGLGWHRIKGMASARAAAEYR